jgi:hypothetical protein
MNTGGLPALTPIPAIPSYPSIADGRSLCLPGSPGIPGAAGPDGPHGWLADWYQRDFLELDAGDQAPRAARAMIRERLPLWGLGHLTEAAQLVATELISNSSAATVKNLAGLRLPPVRVWLLGGDASVAICVWDAVRQPPVPREAGRDDENGRGLAIVEALSAGWDHYFPAHPLTGKVTRAFISEP